MGDNERVDFEWLADLSKGQAFTTCGLSRPAKSLDFGADGFTASLTDTHELLQLTRPDATCGLVFLRGGFPDRADSILSRAQRGDDSDTFGTKLLRPEPRSDYPDVELGERKAQGWLNFRWPYAQYELVRRHPEKRDIILGTGTCEIVSFVSDGTVFQIHRLKWGRGSSVNDQDDSDAANSATARFRVGGRVRFGCPCAQAADGPADEDRFATASSGLALCCTSGRYKTTLVLGVQVHGAPQPLAARHMDGNASGISSRRRWIDLSSEYRVKIPFGDHEGVCLVSSYALRAAAEDPQALLTVPGSAPLPDRLQDYLGVDRQSVNMTDRLWTALCSANYEAGEAVELCVVGRCVEQILGVTSIPLQKPRQPSNQEGHELPELALIGNIMTFQYVDVESAFYQIRLLAKTHYFIKSRRLERDFVDEVHYRDLNQIKEEYLKNIRSALGRALTWLFRTDLKPGRLLLAVYSKPVEGAAGNPVFASCARGRVQLTWDGSYNRGCYATMAAWYVYRLCPEAITDRLAKEVLIPLLPQAYTEGMQRADRVKQPSPKANVLQWLHFSCILLLYHELGCEENADHHKHRIDLDVSEVRETQERFEKAVSRLKTSQSDGWSAEHDELDRVILLAEEMALDRLRDNTKSHSLAVSRARQTRRRIRNRRRTAKFHLGPKPWMAARSLSNGPWELQCIHHEASLRVADESNVIAARDRLFEFLLSDYSFMASWDRADAGMIGTWWDIQPVAMVSSTLLDLKVDGKLQAAKSTAPISAPPVDEDSAADGMSKSIGDLRTGSNNLDGVDVDPATRKTLDAGQVALISALTRQLKQSMDELIQAGAGAAGDGMASKAFEWVSQRPPSIYHPNWWVKQRLSHRWSEGFIQNYYRAGHRLSSPPPSTAEEVLDRITPEELRLVNFVDVSQTRTGFRLCAKWRSCTPLSYSWETPRPPSRPRLQSTSISESPENMIDGEGGPSTSEKMRQALNDSLLDTGVKHRIFILQKLSPSLVRAFFRLWHPDAAFTLANHFGAASRFSETRETFKWTTSITISHWTFHLREEHEADEFREQHRQQGLFPPENIAELGLPSSEQVQDIVEEQSSSLVITGDLSGQLWICSYWSPITTPAALAPVAGEVLPRILEKFIHQQASGRCLAFLLLLGHLCEMLSGEYTTLLVTLDRIMEIEDRTLLEGLEDWWGTAESINKLKKMLWGWEALRVFNDKLSSSLSQIQRAQEAMEHFITQEAMHQDQELIQESSIVLDDFKKRCGMLTEVHDKIQLKIKQVTGLRDGISTITNVVDNKTTIQQGNNIRALTYITIAYLPLGFIVGLFSIQHGTFMDGAENWHFGVLTVVFSLATWVLALSLDDEALSFFKAGGGAFAAAGKSAKRALPAKGQTKPASDQTARDQTEHRDWLGRWRRGRRAAASSTPPVELNELA